MILHSSMYLELLSSKRTKWKHSIDVSRPILYAMEHQLREQMSEGVHICRLNGSRGCLLSVVAEDKLVVAAVLDTHKLVGWITMTILLIKDLG